MLWSIPRNTLDVQHKAMQDSGLLRHTTDRTKEVANAYPVEYFVLQPKQNIDGRTVVSFTHLLSNGRLDPDAPAFYGVIHQPLSEEDPRYDNPEAVRVTQENHVIAEDLALRNGVITPYGRQIAETIVLDRLVPPAKRREFAQLRIAHMSILAASVIEDKTLTPPQLSTAVAELFRANEALRMRYLGETPPAY